MKLTKIFLSVISSLLICTSFIFTSSLQAESTPAQAAAITTATSQAPNAPSADEPVRKEEWKKAHKGAPRGPLTEANFDKRWATMSPERKAHLLKMYDTNHDGKLDTAERKAMFEKRKAVREKMLAKFDTNHDGKLDTGERKAMHDQMMAERKARRAKATTGNTTTASTATAATSTAATTTTTAAH